MEANEALGFDAEARIYYPAKAIIDDLKIENVRLITNNPYKIRSLEGLGVNISSRIPIIIPANPHSAGYLRAKANRMEHMLPLDGIAKTTS